MLSAALGSTLGISSSVHGGHLWPRDPRLSPTNPREEGSNRNCGNIREEIPSDNQPRFYKASLQSAPAPNHVGKLELKDGKRMVGKAHSENKNQVYNKVNIEVTNFSYTSQFPFKLSASLPGEGNANLSGKAGPINPQDSSKTHVEVTLKATTWNLATSGFIEAPNGLGGLANLEEVHVQTPSTRLHRHHRREHNQPSRSA